MKRCNEKVVMSTKQTRRNSLNGLFDSQIAILENRNIPEQIIEILQKQRDSVLKKASKMVIGKGNIPFLPIITPIYLGYMGLMSKVWQGSGIGYVSYTSINPEAIADGFRTPDGLYYIYDVEAGKATMGKSPEEAVEIIFNEQSRSALTATEIINLCIATNVLWRRSVWAIGSRSVINEKMPIVFLDDHNDPVLACFHANYKNDRWGSPSCDIRRA